MSSVWGRRRHRRERPSATPSVVSSIALSDSSSHPESGEILSDQPVGPPKTKSPIADISVASTNVPKYSEDDLQRFLKAVLEAQAPAPTPAPIVAEASWEKLKARSLDIYHGKFYIHCYNFCQQYKDYFAIVGATGPTRIFFNTSFFRDQNNFRW